MFAALLTEIVQVLDFAKWGFIGKCSVIREADACRNRRSNHCCIKCGGVKEYMWDIIKVNEKEERRQDTSLFCASSFARCCTPREESRHYGVHGYEEHNI